MVSQLEAPIDLYHDDQQAANVCFETQQYQQYSHVSRRSVESKDCGTQTISGLF